MCAFFLTVSAEDKSDNGELDLEGIDEDEIEKVCILGNMKYDRRLHSITLTSVMPLLSLSTYSRLDGDAVVHVHKPACPDALWVNRLIRERFEILQA